MHVDKKNEKIVLGLPIAYICHGHVYQYLIQRFKNNTETHIKIIHQTTN